MTGNAMLLLRLENFSGAAVEFHSPVEPSLVQFRGRLFHATLGRFPDDAGIYCYHEISPYTLTEKNLADGEAA